MTERVTTVVRTFALELPRIHNDSTTVKAYGEYPGRTASGLALKQGHSKDHRPDLKQLVFSLSISADGAVPVHHKVYAGNRTDDTTHIETWRTVRKKMTEEGAKALNMYPEEREAAHPKTNKMLERFEPLSTYLLMEDEQVVEEFKDNLIETQKLPLSYLHISEEEYWSAI